MTPSLADYVPVSDPARAATLPARWYTHPEFLELEKERIFWRSWQPVGRVETVARAGDFFACEVAGERVLVARGADGELRAFSNTCRHRAGAVAEGRGNQRLFVCRYHGWTYDLAGCLTGAREMDGAVDFDRAKYCLPPIAVATWGGFVFVNLARDAAPLSDWFGDIAAQVHAAGFEPERLTLVERREWIVNCNWKVYADNYLEGYHIPIAHPELNSVIDYDAYRVDTARYYSSQHAPARTAGAASGHANDARALYFWIFPNFMLNMYRDSLSDIILMPIAHDRTRMIAEWFEASMVTPEDKARAQEAIRFSINVKDEDIALCEMVQQGLNSRYYDQGRYSPRRENGVHHFHLLMHEFLSRSAA